jgi:RimJ/RimL family protein N-acetyltransferase
MELELKTARLRLRAYKPCDAEALSVAINNWKIARMLATVPHPYCREMAVEFIEKQAVQRDAGTDFTFAVTHDDALIGGAGVHLGTPDSDAGEIGYWLRQSTWGQGFATEAGSALVRLGFGALGLNELTAGHYFDNPASGRVLKKLGFIYTSVVTRHCMARDADVEVMDMKLTRQTYEAHHDPH